jgi:hypothetical protein
VPVEELDVAEEVLVEVAAADQRPSDRANRVDAERDDEQEDGAGAPVGQPLEAIERARELPERAAQDDCPAPAALEAGLRKRCMSCRPLSAAGLKVTRSRSAPSRSCTYEGGWYALQRLVPGAPS